MRFPAATLAVIAVLGLTACTPAIRGAVGISIGVNGVPIAVLEPCEGTAAGLVLSDVDDDNSYQGEMGRWDLDEVEDPMGVEFIPTHLAPRDDDRLELTAWATYDTWNPSSRTKNLRSVFFEIRDLAALAAGDVLYADRSDYGRFVIGTREEFDAAACSD